MVQHVYTVQYYDYSLLTSHYLPLTVVVAVVVVLLAFDDARRHRGVVAENSTVLDPAGAAGILPN